MADMLRQLLSEQFQLCGPETAQQLPDAVVLYSDAFGSRRFVKYVYGRPVSGLQIVVRGDLQIVANVYTHLDYRRRGYATELFRVAKAMFPRLEHSLHRTATGDLFVQSFESAKSDYY